MSRTAFGHRTRFMTTLEGLREDVGRFGLTSKERKSLDRAVARVITRAVTGRSVFATQGRPPVIHRERFSLTEGLG